MPAAPLMLSISGARGIVGESMTPETAVRFAGAFGSHVRAAGGEPRPTVCLGRDTRASSDMLGAAAAAGLAAVGARVIDLGVVSTPTVAVMIGVHDADGGMMVTASHNPPDWNGLKCITAEGEAPPRGVADEIVRRFHDRDLLWVAPGDIAARVSDARGPQEHVGRVLAEVDGEAIRAAALTCVLDSNGGAGGEAGRLLLERLGCRVIHLNATPGLFAHGLEPIEENLDQPASAVAGEGADLGFVQDPDADRLAVIDEKGRAIGEEYTLVLAARRVLAARGPGPVVVNLSTSRMIDDVARSVPGASVVRTPVGEANVVEAMRRSGAILGGEGNGGVVFAPVCMIRDSLSAMALVLGLRAAETRPLSEIAGDLPRYVMIKHRLDLADAGGPDALRPALERVAARFAGDGLNTDDGVRLDVDDGWVHLRPSNTEPIVRVIAEAPTDARCRELIDQVVAAMT